MKRVLLLFLLVACASTPRVVFDNGVSFVVEIADSPGEHAQGLMFRESLPEGRGMLFVFEESAPRTFWMKDTKIPLDMVFLDENGTVVEVKDGVLPCAEDPCQQYRSKPARFVLEVNGGLAEKNGIDVGSRMNLLKRR